MNMKEGVKFTSNKKVAVAIVILLVVIAGILIYASLHGKKNVPSCTTDSCSISEIQNQSAGIANPASVYCESHNGTLIIVTASDGSQSGLCTLSSGKQCDEWAYFRGECQ